MRKIYVEFEKSGQAAVYDHEWVRLAMQKVEELERFSEPVQTYQQAINLLQGIANWLRDHGHAHYFCVDTKQAKCQREANGGRR